MSTVIVGAGVIGLTTALCLCEQGGPPPQITVIAKHLPVGSLNDPEYTSAWAGAHFRPFPSKNAAEEREYPLTRSTQTYFRKLARQHPESSVEFVTGEDHVEAPPDSYRQLAPSYVAGIDNFEVLTETPFSARYDTWVVNPPIYLVYLFNRLRVQYGVRFVQKSLDSLRGAFDAVPDAAILINCSGRGLLYNGEYDPQCYPIRGQTLLVRPPYPVEQNPYRARTVTHQLADGNWSFVITRPLHGGVIIGGTKQPHDSDPQPRDVDTRQVLEHAAVWFPELMHTSATGEKYFDVLKVNVGFRPARRGGVRLEAESVDGRVVIHAYGVAGSGYELSYGVANEVYQMWRRAGRAKI
ncbi:FAD dependent oxidoreductase domain-containing protein [[Candida] zeylanoides]